MSALEELVKIYKTLLNNQGFETEEWVRRMSILTYAAKSFKSNFWIFQNAELNAKFFLCIVHTSITLKGNFTTIENAAMGENFEVMDKAYVFSESLSPEAIEEINIALGEISSILQEIYILYFPERQLPS